METSDLLHIFIMWVLILLDGWFPASNEYSRVPMQVNKEGQILYN